ncbi:helix-turn-helix domain-containing protein [Streptomyces sp. NPDC006798]|uniref:helix-turn-helix domain-containing protein n=1 Tax=Streptomyces sp. NPDC006798 TaxID=3155462 RepID=UPI0033D1EF86
MAARDAGETGGTGRLDELLRRVRHHGPGEPDPGPDELVEWLGARLGAHVALVDRTGTAETATAAFPRRLLPPLKPLLGRLSDGALDTAATETADGTGTVRLRLEALGDRAPRPVLVVAAPDALDRESALLVSHTGGLLVLLRRAGRADAVTHAYDRKAGQVRLAVFMALMAGDPPLARRMTAGAVPGLLAADRLRVQLLRCSPEDRDRIARDLQDASGYHGPALMVRCPVYENHLICVIAEGTHEHPEGPGAALRRLVGENGHYALGVSDPRPLDETADAYEQARHTLALARSVPGRIAVADGGLPLGRVLPAAPAAAWARNALRPLDTVPKLTREITRLALAFPRSGVARLLGISRNSVAAHLERAGQALGADLGDVRTRAALALALSVPGPGTGVFGPDPTPGGGARTPVPRPAPVLDDLLRTPPAVTWARSFLAPLPDGPRDLRGTLGAWIDANTDARRAARRLGVGRNTVGDRLRTAGRLLHRDLPGTHSGVYDLVHALAAEALTAGERAAGDPTAADRTPDPGSGAGPRADGPPAEPRYPSAGSRRSGRDDERDGQSDDEPRSPRV